MENPIKMDDLGYHYFWKYPYVRPVFFLGWGRGRNADFHVQDYWEEEQPPPSYFDPPNPTIYICQLWLWLLVHLARKFLYTKHLPAILL